MGFGRHRVVLATVIKRGAVVELDVGELAARVGVGRLGEILGVVRRC